MAQRERTWRSELDSGGEQVVRWSGVSRVEITTLRDRLGEPDVQNLPWYELFLRPYLVADRRHLTELFLEAADSREDPPSPLDDAGRLRWAFWKRFHPEHIPHLEADSVSPEGERWRSPRSHITTRFAGLHRDPPEPPHATLLWDEVYRHGPGRGALPLTFRRALRDALKAALDEEGPETFDLFPLLDYERLPKGVQEHGDARCGGRAHFAEGWLIWDGWDNRGRPEGGRVVYSPEAYLTGALRHITVSRAQREAILEAARIDS